MNNIILASSSLYRRQLLKRLCLPFDWKSPNIDESVLLDESSEEYVKRLSLEKAHAVAKNYNNYFVLGSDQVAIFEQEIIGKPLTHNNAYSQLKKFSGKRVKFLTGVALVNRSQKIERFVSSEVLVNFRSLSGNEIESYLIKDKPFDCAGSFKVESLGISLFESVCSDDPTSLEGLPLIKVSSLLREAGFKI